MRYVVAVLLLFGLLAGPASAEGKRCKSPTHTRNLGVVQLKATNTRCEIARSLAVGYDNLSLRREPRVVYTPDGRKWRCKITSRATGTDPGYNPYTRVRCALQGKTVRWGLAS